MVVGRWKELYKDLSNDTDSWLLDVKKRESIEVMYDSVDILLNLAVLPVSSSVFLQIFSHFSWIAFADPGSFSYGLVW